MTALAAIGGARERLHRTFTRCGQRGLLLRYDELPDRRAWLRFGLPGDHLPRLEEILKAI